MELLTSRSSPDLAGQLSHRRVHTEVEAPDAKGIKILAPEPSDESKEIPCLFFPQAHGTSKILLFFHGNAEDVGIAAELLDYLRSMLMVHVLAVEYPGYGVYNGTPDAGQIYRDAEAVFDYLVRVHGIRQEQILLFGRSIGSGPATYLASERNPSALLLLAPFKSIRSLIYDSFGAVASGFVRDRFQNVEMIKKVTCPTFIVHGQKDTLVSPAHSHALHKNCGGPCALLSPKHMSHNRFDFIDDLIQPCVKFLQKCKLGESCDEDSISMFFPDELYRAPSNHATNGRPGSAWRWLVSTLFSSSFSSSASSSSATH